MRRAGPVSALRGVAALLVLVLLAAACGSRRSIDEIATAAGGTIAVGADAADPADPAAETAGLPALPDDDLGDVTLDLGDEGDGGAVEDPADGADAAAEQPDGTPVADVETGGGGAGAPGEAAGAPAGGTPAQPAQGSAGQPAAPSGSGATATRSTIRIGVVGTLSGVGGTQRGSARAVQAWAQWRNANGGVNGHPVEVLVVDDGGDPARFRSALQELVEQRGVIAFVGIPSGFTMTDGAVAYLEGKRVPVVGGDRLGAAWNASPMLFPQASAGDAVIWNHIVNTHRLGGDGAAVGWVTCQEAQICRDADRLWQEYAPALGLEVRYRAQVSVAQPNFTAECTRAMQAGVEHFILGTDANSIRRLASDCARQGYHPSFGVLQTSDEQAREPALDGGYFASATFPWVARSTPATREFQEVMQTHAPNVELSAHASSGWVAAKLFERAARDLGEPATSEQVLEGLWSIRDDTLGGLTSALTFRREEPAPSRYCFFAMQMRSGAWALDSEELRCRAP